MLPRCATRWAVAPALVAVVVTAVLPFGPVAEATVSRDARATDHRALCGAFDAITAARERAGRHGVDGLSRAAITDYFDHQRRRVVAAARAASGDLAASLEREADLDDVFTVLVSAAWGRRDGRDVTASAQRRGYFNAFDYIARGGLVSLDGTRTSAAQYNQLLADNRAELAQECRSFPANERRLTSGAAADVPDGTILFSNGSTVRAVAAGGGAARDVLHLDDTSLVSDLAAAPGGTELAFSVVSKTEFVAQTWVAGVDGAGAHEVVADRGGGRCPSWGPDAGALVVTYLGAGSSTFRLFRDEALVSTRRISTPVLCAAYLTRDRLVVDIAEGFEGDPGLATLPVAGGSLVDLARIPGCALEHPVPSPDRLTVAAIAACIDPSRNGVYLVPATGGTPRQILGGNVGSVAWSPDGTWLAYTHARIGVASGNDEAALFVAKADGSEFFELDPGPALAPAWIR